MTDALFLIESGKPLELVKAYIADKIRIRKENNALALELGVTDFFTDRTTSAMRGVTFPGNIHPDFAKPKKRNGGSYPKRGTDWSKRLNALKGTANAADQLATELGIPRTLEYTSTTDGATGHGWRHIGSPLTECGFLFLSVDGPYAMWAPDVPAIIQSMHASGEKVIGANANFDFNIPGVRRILKEEWDLMVAQDNLKKAHQPVENASPATASA